MPNPQREYTTFLLFVGLIVFSFAVVTCAVILPANEKIYVFMSSIAGMFAGSFFTWITKQGSEK